MAERFGLDTNILVYLLDGRDPPRQGRARQIVDLAARTGRCMLSVQSLGELYVVAVRKALAPPEAVQRMIDNLVTIFPVVTPTVADARIAIAAAVAQRFSYWDALLLATLGRAGCIAVLTEDMRDGATLEGAVVRNPFAGEAMPAEIEALLS